jgi:hypothetical protein
MPIPYSKTQRSVARHRAAAGWGAIPVSIAAGGNGHVYGAGRSGVVVRRALAAQQATFGNKRALATITSQAENDFIASRIRASRRAQRINRSVAGFAEPDGGWRWVTNEPWQFTHWYPANPNNESGAENYMETYFQGGTLYWNDMSHTLSNRPQGYLIEYPLDAPLETVSVIAPGATWRYLDDGSDQATAWQRMRSIFHTFVVDDPQRFTGLMASVRRDDGIALSQRRRGCPRFARRRRTCNDGQRRARRRMEQGVVRRHRRGLLRRTQLLAVEMHQATATSRLVVRPRLDACGGRGCRCWRTTRISRVRALPRSFCRRAWNGTVNGAFTSAGRDSWVDTFIYSVSDGVDTSEPATVTIAVDHAAPVAAADTYATDEDAPLVVAIDPACWRTIRRAVTPGCSLGFRAETRRCHRCMAVQTHRTAISRTPVRGRAVDGTD